MLASLFVIFSVEAREAVRTGWTVSEDTQSDHSVQGWVPWRNSSCHSGMVEKLPIERRVSGYVSVLVVAGSSPVYAQDVDRKHSEEELGLSADSRSCVQVAGHRQGIPVVAVHSVLGDRLGTNKEGRP